MQKHQDFQTLALELLVAVIITNRSTNMVRIMKQQKITLTVWLYFVWSYLAPILVLLDRTHAHTNWNHRKIISRIHASARDYENHPFLFVRGGNDEEEHDECDEYDEYDEYDDYEEEDVDEKVVGEDSNLSETISGGDLMDKLATLSSQVLFLIGKKLTTSIKAGLERWKESTMQDLPVFDRIMKTIRKIWDAMLVQKLNTEPSQGEGKSQEESNVLVEKEVKEEVEEKNFRKHLAKAYGIDREGKNPTTISGGSINDALRLARSNARLLVVLILASKAGRGNPNSLEYKAVDSFLSSEVSDMAEKKSRKNTETGSFVLWTAEAGSSDASAAMKRLKVKYTKKKGEKRPLLLVAYAAQVVSPSGSARMTPKLLAQHHCNPPPSSGSMAAWLNAIRRRHVKQYAAMQLEIREAQLYKERVEGYRDSVKSDAIRKEKERKEEEKRVAMEKVEKERLEALESRREELLSTLPPEPNHKEKQAITIALRFADGRSDKRRFLSETQLSVVFDWIDACFRIEREIVVLTTMNGKQVFTWDEVNDKSLSSAGLGRMTGFRVTEKKEEEEKAEEEDE